MKSFVSKYNNYLTYLFILIILISFKIINPTIVKSISFLSFDLYQKVFPLRKQNSDVIIVDIDEKSLSKFGQFPWNRSVFAKILSNINEAEPKVIGFDVFLVRKISKHQKNLLKLMI